MMVQKLSISNCKSVLSQNYIGRLAYIFNNKPYIVPITYYFDVINNAIVGYSGNGHKTKALRINGSVSIEVAEFNSVNNWKSVLAQGTYREFEGSSAKINLRKFSDGVKDVINNNHGKQLNYISEFSSKIYKEGPSIVFKIEIEELVGRERQR